jgi:hypothetical protein
LSKKRKRRVEVVNLDDFQFDPSSLDLKWSKDFITVLDGYRIHRCYDLTFIEKAVEQGVFPQSFIRQWRVIRTVLHKFAAVAPNVPGVEKMLFRRQIISFAMLIMITISLPLTIFGWAFNVTFLAPLIFPIALVVAVLAFTTWTISNYYNNRVAWAIVNYLDSNPQLLAREHKHLKIWVQILIWHTARQIRRESKPLEEERIKFFNDDYDGISVLKAPRHFRKNYVVVLNPHSKSEA